MKSASRPRWVGLLGWAVTVIVAGAVVAAFPIIGSPIQARKEKADERRIHLLSGTVTGVREFYKKKKTLPDDLSKINVTVKWDADEAPQDPVSGKTFEYRKLDEATFELCAVFEAASTNRTEHRNAYGDRRLFTHHPAGRYCFKISAKAEDGEQE